MVVEEGRGWKRGTRSTQPVNRSKIPQRTVPAAGIPLEEVVKSEKATREMKKERDGMKEVTLIAEKEGKKGNNQDLERHLVNGQ